MSDPAGSPRQPMAVAASPSPAFVRVLDAATDAVLHARAQAAGGEGARDALVLTLDRFTRSLCDGVSLVTTGQTRAVAVAIAAHRADLAALPGLGSVESTT